MSERRDLYQAAGLSILSSDAEIKRASRQASRATHPDHGGDARAFRDQREVFEVLTRRREHYDEALIRDSAKALQRVGAELQRQRTAPVPTAAATVAVTRPPQRPVPPEPLSTAACVAAAALGAGGWLFIHGLDGRYAEALAAAGAFSGLACAGGAIAHALGWRGPTAASLAVAATVALLILLAEHRHAIADVGPPTAAVSALSAAGGTLSATAERSFRERLGSRGAGRPGRGGQ